MYRRYVERITDIAIAVFLWTFRIAVFGVVIIGSALTLLNENYAPQVWVRLIIDGLTLGSVYALIALGYTMVYGILRMINFAHGEVFAAGAFGGYFTGAYLLDSGFLNANVIASLIAVAAMILVAMGVAAGVALLVERIAYRPLRNAPRLVPLISAIGASFFLQYTYRGFFGSRPYVYPNVAVLERDVGLGFVPLKWVEVLVVVSAIVMMALLYLFVMRTRTGIAIRAVSEDKATAALMGIDVNRAIVTTFAVGAAMADLLATLSWLNSLLKKSSASTACELLTTTLPSLVNTSPPFWNRNHMYCCQIGLALKPLTRNLSPSRLVALTAVCSRSSQVAGALALSSMSLRYISVCGALSTGTP
jgi:branched-chain amino acid transport system permease protein